MFEILKTNLFLFDGEAAGTASDGGNSEAQGEVSGGKATVDNPNIPLHLLRNKPKAFENVAKTGGEDTVQQGEVDKKTEPTYEEIKERYKDDFKKDMDSQFGRRLKTVNSENAKLKTSNEKMQEVLNLLGSNYPGVDASNPEALLTAMKNDERLFRQKAIDNGTSVAEEQFTYEKEAELQNVTRQLAKVTMEQAKQKTFAELTRQSETLKGEYPDFSLEKALENETFRAMLAFTKNSQGVENVKDAYEFAFKDELREKALQQTVNKTKEAMSQNRKAKQFLPSPPGTTSKSVNNNSNALEQMGAKEFAKLAYQGKNLRDFFK